MRRPNHPKLTVIVQYLKKATYVFVISDKERYNIQCSDALNRI